MQDIVIRSNRTDRIVFKLQGEQYGSLASVDVPNYIVILNTQNKMAYIYSLFEDTFYVNSEQQLHTDKFEVKCTLNEIRFTQTNKLFLNTYCGKQEFSLQQLQSIDSDFFDKFNFEQVSKDVVGDYRNLYDVLYGMLKSKDAPLNGWSDGYTDILKDIDYYHKELGLPVSKLNLDPMERSELSVSDIGYTISGIHCPQQILHKIDYFGEDDALDLYFVETIGKSEYTNAQIGQMTQVFGTRYKISKDLNNNVTVKQRKFENTLFHRYGLQILKRILERDNFRIGFCVNDEEEVSNFTKEQFMNTLKTEQPFVLLENEIRSVILDYLDMSDVKTEKPSRIKDF